MKFSFTLLAILFAFYARAQRCATDSFSVNNGPMLQAIPNGASQIATGRDTLPNEVIVIPVVIHVLYNNSAQNISDEQILSQIKSLNEDYRRLNADTIFTPAPFKKFAADTRIIFCLSKVDPQGRYTSGIIRKYTKEQYWLSDDEMKFSSKGGDDAWVASKYLNIWVCNLFGRTLGYSVFPGGPPERDGVVIQSNVFGTTGALNPEFNKGRTATHEIGHWLGLQHLWGDGACGDDGVGDTPPQQTNNTYCPSFPHTSLCSADENGDMYMDFMDFTDDVCMNMFTTGQKNKMRSLFALGNPRNSFLNSNVCDSSLAEGGPLPGDTLIAGVKISVYPNPFSNQVIISSANASDVIGRTLKLYDVTGKLYFSKILDAQKTILPVTNLPAGIYIIKIGGLKSQGIFKLIKQNGYLK